MIRRLLANQRQPDNIAVIEDGKELRYIDLQKKAWAIPLTSQRQQETVAILLPNGGEYIAALWRVLHAGMIAFPLNALMTKHEIHPLLKQASVGTVITNTTYRHIFEDASGFETLSPHIIYVDMLWADCPEPKYTAADPNSPMLLLATSGTTGQSKIVQLSERNVESCVLGYIDKLCYDETNIDAVRYTLAVPFSSVYGMMILSVCLMRSFTLVVLDGEFTLDTLYQAAEKHRITHYEGSGSAILLMEQMAGRPIPYDIHTLKYFGFGGSKVSGETIEKVHAAYPDMGFYQGYGMTEASPLISKHPQLKIQKMDSVGTAIRGMEIAIEANNEITNAPFTEGEIIVRGPSVMLGYLDNDTETSRVLKNGYLYTGDIGYLDDEGYLYICGRKKIIIIVRGFNVYPEEVEACIRNSMLVKDCYVYGQADGYGSEVVCADVVPVDPQVSEEQIRTYCGAHLAEYKRPQKISFRAFRKTAAGKTERY